jgi:cytoskeletal protein CcmA (bactofilin family)
MFKKREYTSDSNNSDHLLTKPIENIEKQKTNSILKGSKLTGDIIISYDLELDGDVEGNIIAEEKSNVVIKGNCRGSITVKEGNVGLEGQMSNGDIIAGNNVTVTGTFNGGKITAQGKISINGKFNGVLKGKDVEIGPDTQGVGEIFYSETISIARGANIEVQIKKTLDKQKKPNKSTSEKVVPLEPPVREATAAQN